METYLSLKDAARLVFDQIYKNKKNILDAYSYCVNKYKFDYSYNEIKDYLFHHDLKNT